MSTHVETGCRMPTSSPGAEGSADGRLRSTGISRIPVRSAPFDLEPLATRLVDA